MPIYIGTNQGGARVGLDPKALTTHMTIVGMTGSGKTGLVLNVVEELVRNGIPSVILDIKGDMANVFQQTDSAVMALIKPVLLTPGANHGDSVDIASGLEDPTRTSEAVTALLNLIKVPSDPITSRYHAFLCALIAHRLAKKYRARLGELVYLVQDPPFEHLGSMALDEVIGNAARKSLAAKINNVLIAHSFEHWRTGVALDIRKLLTPTDSRVPVVVYSVAHLANDDERDFAINLLLEEMVSFMRKSPGSPTLVTSMIVDECYGLMPPRGNSPMKTALMTLLKQGRAAGLGVILATQNPMDLDYKGMANCATWIVGRLQTTNDRRRLVEGVCNSVPGLDKSKLEAKIGGLAPRQFLLARGGQMVPFLSQDTACTLSGPMSIEDLKAVHPKPPQPMSVVGKIISLFGK